MPALTLIHGTGRGTRHHRAAAVCARGSSTGRLRLLSRPGPVRDDAMAEERVRQRLQELGVRL
ncbi:hypothetical protein [Streptomyces sp. NPDC058268]|uniref:hypothetical protein n=1 Tax=Streptomyces sp. NPDC058268 TaxID=3346413 RepID=UPI0036E4B113